MTNSTKISITARSRASAQRGKLTYTVGAFEREFDGWFYSADDGCAINARKFRGRNWFTLTFPSRVVSFEAQK